MRESWQVCAFESNFIKQIVFYHYVECKNKRWSVFRTFLTFECSKKSKKQHKIKTSFLEVSHLAKLYQKILPERYSKSITSIRNISLKPNQSSILNSLMMLLKYALSRLLLIQLLVLPRWGFSSSESINSFNNTRVARSAILNCRMNGLLKNSNF